MVILFSPSSSRSPSYPSLPSITIPPPPIPFIPSKVGDPGYDFNLPPINWDKASVTLAWLYQQSSGKLFAPESLTSYGAPDKSWNIRAIGYSGHEAGLNNSALQNVVEVGPIPKGCYQISRSFDHPKLGPVVMRLSPYKDTNTFGRNGFCIHGDNMDMNHTASEGCIIFNRVVRQFLSSGVSRLLQVF